MRACGMGLFVLALAGCGTTRTTDTTRAATEMLLVSQAIDRAVGQIDFSPLRGKAVHFDVSMIDSGTVDKGYVVSSIRQQLLAHGAHVMEDKRDAVYIVEARVGAVGTDRHSLLFGSPQITVPAIIPGIPTSIPEIALYKRTDQKGVAKLAVFAYNRVTGRAVWQSGLVEDVSRLKDRWVLGSGPYSTGTIRRSTELAGEALPTLPQLPTIPIIGREENPESAANEGKTDPKPLPEKVVQYTNADEPIPPQPVPFGVLGITGPAPVVLHPILTRTQPGPRREPNP
jgi:hypothetical protein